MKISFTSKTQIKSSKMIYSYPSFSNYDFGLFNISGSGLGNCLFPWSRYIINTKKYNLRPISPTWVSIKLGPYIRQEKDKRTYYGLFNTRQDMIKGYQKLFYLLTLKKIDETCIDKIVKRNTQDPFRRIIIFKGLRDYFEGLLSHHELIKENLLQLVNEKHLKGKDCKLRNSISLHIRLGDFLIGKQNTEIKWFINAIKYFREKVNRDLTVYIFTDAYESQISEILNLSKVEILSFGSSIADIIAMSNSNVIIGSKNSTFSLWPAFIGQKPIVLPSDGHHLPIYDKSDIRQIYWDGCNPLPEEFLRICMKNLEQSE